MTAGLPRGLDRLPPGFAWGAATAAYQIEGSWNADGKGPSIWDDFTHRPGTIANGDTGDVACDHYRRWREDVDLMASLGLTAYRFSVSWARVIPAGVGAVNAAGLDFYDRLVDALLERGIEPFVTLYHWDLPLALQQRGGWPNRDVAGWFAEYADATARRLGDRVTRWMTLNEPQWFVFGGHGYGIDAPGHRDWRTALRAGHHALLAHWSGSDAIRAAAPAARVGIALDLADVQPATGSEADRSAAQRLDAGSYRWFLDPVMGRGYPGDVVAWYGSTMTGIDAEGAIHAHRPVDFIGLNYYTRRFVAAAADGPLHARAVDRPGAQVTAMGWEVHPSGLRRMLERLAHAYRAPTIYVTENGAAYDDEPAPDGAVHDPERTGYLHAHIEQVLAAAAAGVDVAGYFAWSLLDNFEWSHGYAKRFGIVRVDYRTQRRTVKDSGRWYAGMIAAAAAGE
ncbi:MAG: GH1 family beta-glucosidase [Chloroflexota bacterium]|nr:GH1 family beta-glucosidase [Chloroflexota bacterium]